MRAAASAVRRWRNGQRHTDLRPKYSCQACGHVLRVSGHGRHRGYFELDDERSDDPVMNRGQNGLKSLRFLGYAGTGGGRGATPSVSKER